MDDLKLFIQNEIVNIAFKKVAFDDSLISSKLLDSITLVELLIAIEEYIGKQIPQHLINDDNFESIDKIIETIKKI
jgi:acyl carrier protein